MGFLWQLSVPLAASLVLLYMMREDESLDPGPLTCGDSELRIRDRVIVITGATGVIGYQVALELARRGARLVLGCRDSHRGRAVRQRIVEATNNTRVSVAGLDLASMRHVSTFAWNILDKMELDRVDVLINAAATAPRGWGEREVTSEGLERVMATNLLGPMHLANRLLKAFSEDAVVINLVEAEPDNMEADIDNINSAETYDAGHVYQQSKYYLRLVTQEMAGRFSKVRPGLRVHSVEPSPVMSSLHSPVPAWLTRALLPLLGQTSQAREAARTAVWLAGGGAGEAGGTWGSCQMVTEREEGDTGGLWRRCEELIHNALA